MSRVFAILLTVAVGAGLGCFNEGEKEGEAETDRGEQEAVDALMREGGGVERWMDYLRESSKAKNKERSNEPPAYAALFERAKSLPHVAATGQTPQDVLKLYGERLKEGDRSAAVDVLVLVASVIGKEGGIFDKSLAEAVAEALAVVPSEAFVGMLWASIPNECVFTNSSRDGVANAGYSRLVLRLHKALAEKVWRDSFAAKVAGLPAETRQLCQWVRSVSVTGVEDESIPAGGMPGPEPVAEH